METDDDKCAGLTEAASKFSPEFLKLQYEALRTEILSTQRRAFQLMAAGVLGLPLLSYFIQGQARSLVGGVAVASRTHMNAAYALVLTLALPFVVIVIALLYLADNNAIIRAGFFIRHKIEPLVPVPGWETWLEKHPKHRGTERHVTVAVYILFLLYYVASVYLAWPAAQARFTVVGAACIMTGYGAIGLGVAVYFVKQILLTTTALEDQLATVAVSAASDTTTKM